MYIYIYTWYVRYTQEIDIDDIVNLLSFPKSPIRRGHSQLLREASPSGSRADHSLHGLWQSQTPTGRMAGP